MIRGADSLAQPCASRRPVRFGLAAALLLPLISLLATPAIAAKPARAAKQRLVLETQITPFQPQVGEFGRFAFTAPGAPAMPQSLNSGFRFTPSGQAENQRVLSLGVSTRVTTAAVDRSRAAAPVDRFVVPAGYGVNVSLGWHGFAIDTGYNHVDPQMSAPFTVPLAGRMTDQLNLGLSYGGRNWRTALQGTAEQSQPLAFAPLTRRYGLELGGAYRVAPRFSVTGGVRYRIAPEPPSLVLPNKDDRSVYFGTSIAF
ncbi:MAG: hypothetical protein WCO11_00535 [Sphingomonadales bacterium]|jgi:hypothetical protein